VADKADRRRQQEREQERVRLEGVNELSHTQESSRAQGLGGQVPSAARSTVRRGAVSAGPGFPVVDDQLSHEPSFCMVRRGRWPAGPLSVHSSV
jgi:hypothetical protein